MRTIGGTLFLVIAAAAPAIAQTNDPFFRSSEWRETLVGAEGAGLAGAFVAVPDRAGAVAVNPGALASLGRIEFFANLVHNGSGDGILGDRLASQTAIGLIGGGGKVTENVAVGGYISQSSKSSATLSEVVLQGTRTSGFFRRTVTDVGGSAAVKVSQRLHLGAQLVASHLFLEADALRSGAGDPLRAGSGGGQTLVSFGIGGLYTLTEKMTLGLSGFAGASWNPDRTAVNTVTGRVFDTGSKYELRRPSTLSTGVSYRVNRRVLVSGQMDYVRYAEIRNALSIVQGAASSADYQLGNALEPRLGVEAAFAPSNAVSVVFRGGLRQLASGALRYRGPNAVEAATFVGSDRTTIVSGGGSVLLRQVHFHLAIEGGGTSSTAWMGVGTRF